MSEDVRFQEEHEEEVSLFQGSRPFVSLVKNDEGIWDLEPIGEVTRNRVEQGTAGDLFSYTYRSNQLVKGEHQTYQIGSVRSSGFLDHTQVYEPLLEQGWTVQQHDIQRGGLDATTIFSYPDVQFKDPVDWDHRLFANDLLGNPFLSPSIMVRANVKAGSRYHVTAGLFRLICTNGLVAQALGLGHANFTIWRDLASTVSGTVKQIGDDARTMAPFDEKTSRLFPTRSTRWLATALREEDDSLKPEMISDAIKALTRHLDPAERAALALNFALMATQHASPTVSVIDILNGITNASPSRAYSSLDAALQAANDLLELGEYITA